MAEQEMTFTYQVQDFTATISTEEYIRRFSNSECFIKYCKECRNYGKVWVCPPFSHDTMAELRQYANLFLVATKIIPDEKKIPFSEVNRFFRPERLRIEKKIAGYGNHLQRKGICLRRKLPLLSRRYLFKA